jgi:hypothetical protein
MCAYTSIHLCTKVCGTNYQSSPWCESSVVRGTWYTLYSHKEECVYTQQYRLHNRIKSSLFSLRSLSAPYSIPDASGGNESDDNLVSYAINDELYCCFKAAPHPYNSEFEFNSWNGMNRLLFRERLERNE